MVTCESHDGYIVVYDRGECPVCRLEGEIESLNRELDERNESEGKAIELEDKIRVLEECNEKLRNKLDELGE